MAIQFISRAKASIIGELTEPPVFQETASGAKFAKIKLQTVKHFISKGERKSRRDLHDVTVFNKMGVDLLGNFGKPGVHFLIDAEITYNNGRTVYEVSQYGGEIYVMTTGVDSAASETGQAAAARSASTQIGSGASKSTTAAGGARPSGGLGRVGGRPASSSAQSEDEGRYTSMPARTDAELDDDIPF